MNLIHEVIDSKIKIYDAKENVEEEKVVEWHFHNELELFFLYEGQKFFCTKNKKIKLEKGDIVFVNSRIPHKTLTPIGSRGMLIQFNNDFYLTESAFDKYIPAFMKNNEPDIYIFPANTYVNIQLYECMKKISQEYSNKNKFYNMYIKSYVFEMLAYLYRYDILVEPHKATDISDILSVLDYISKHYSQHISLEDVSNLIHVEKTYFCKLFKKATKTSFLDYLNFVRIYNAEILLRKTKKTVTEISIETGFSSASYFSETFKKINSLSPTSYRKMILNDSAQ